MKAASASSRKTLIYCLSCATSTSTSANFIGTSTAPSYETYPGFQVISSAASTTAQINSSTSNLTTSECCSSSLLQLLLLFLLLHLHHLLQLLLRHMRLALLVHRPLQSLATLAAATTTAFG